MNDEERIFAQVSNCSLKGKLFCGRRCREHGGVGSANYHFPSDKKMPRERHCVHCVCLLYEDKSRNFTLWILTVSFVLCVRYAQQIKLLASAKNIVNSR